MLIPFADFLNHNNDSVYHYMLKQSFEQLGAKVHKDYVVKNGCLDLTLLGLDSREHKKYEPNQRIQLIQRYRP
jgi:hypothetical protein